MLKIRVLGGLDVIRDGVAVTLPPSRKTRALLAYLALTRSSHRREELCEIFWDVPDDPRGSLRWSLSKIRPLVDEPAFTRLAADRQSIELRTDALEIDFLSAQTCAAHKAVATDDLVRAAALFRGPLLADLELPENGGFHSWLLGLREDARTLQAKILHALIERLGATPQEALPYARELVRVDPFDETAWAQLIDTLARLAAAAKSSSNTRPPCAPCATSGVAQGLCCVPGVRRNRPPAIRPTAARRRRPRRRREHRSSCCPLPI